MVPVAAWAGWGIVRWVMVGIGGHQVVNWMNGVREWATGGREKPGRRESLPLLWIVGLLVLGVIVERRFLRGSNKPWRR